MDRFRIRHSSRIGSQSISRYRSTGRQARPRRPAAVHASRRSRCAWYRRGGVLLFVLAVLLSPRRLARRHIAGLVAVLLGWAGVAGGVYWGVMLRSAERLLSGEPHRMLLDRRVRVGPRVGRGRRGCAHSRARARRSAPTSSPPSRCDGHTKPRASSTARHTGGVVVVSVRRPHPRRQRRTHRALRDAPPRDRRARIAQRRPSQTKNRKAPPERGLSLAGR